MLPVSDAGLSNRHCEERRDEAIHGPSNRHCPMDCVASLAMTAEQDGGGDEPARNAR
jgi:hypothetical protein